MVMQIKEMSNSIKLLSKYILLLVFSLPFLCCSTPDFYLTEKSIDPQAEYHELPDEVKKMIFGTSTSIFDEPPYPIGGMQAFMNQLTYTEEARKYWIEGRIFVQADIDESGKVTSIKPINKLGYGLDDIAYKAIRNTKFKPAMKEGKPVYSTVMFPVVFKLKD